ncbi:unnamed protein product [Darwinula stevensoni]|uniref:SSD domain-containing protein n=1 Tax=Darwinula stevensoni TaxID=69355 RepID=A0A7R9AEZ4_9CRUS|nr:unnamed protein product [Darwinula stevensoni]CAG0902809.1 unnamed protein product [Darwinula stevensoni]
MSTSRQRSSHLPSRLGCLLAHRPWTFILASVILSSCLISGVIHWREEEGGTVKAWFAPGTPIYRTDQWIKKNFPNGVRYETIILSGPDVLTPEYFKYMGTLDKEIRSLVSNGYAWEDVCARYKNLETTKENETTTTPTTEKTARISQAEVNREGDSKEPLQYDDYNNGWKEDSDASEVFGGEEEEITLYDGSCIYSSTLQLWAEDFDFSTITTAEIQDKVTRALDDNNEKKFTIETHEQDYGIHIINRSRNDVKGMLSGVERDESGRVVGAAAVMFVYILKDRANATNRKGQPVDLIAEPWEEKFLELMFHNGLPKPPGLKIYANAERSFRDGISEMRDKNMIYFALGFVLITIYVAINMGKFNLLEQRVQSQKTATEMSSDSTGTMEPETSLLPILISSFTTENLETTKENETTTTPTTGKTARISQAEVNREGDSKELLQHNDYNNGWKEDSDASEVFGGEEEEITLYDGSCIYSSTLQLWAEDFDFSTITTAEIQDKVTRALDDKSRNDVKGMLSEVERDESGRVVGAVAVMFVYILKDRANATNRKGLPVYLGLAVVLCIGLTIVSAAGLCLSIGYIPTEIHNLMPFLILGIGIDDSLVIIQVTHYDLHVTRCDLHVTRYDLRASLSLVSRECLENVVSKERTLNPEERVGEALRQAGVSITITSITDVFAFAIGATTTVPVLRSFCIYTTAGIFIVYVMTLIFMVPILSLDERRRDNGREGCLCIRLPADYNKNSCSQKLLLKAIFHKIVGPLLVKTPVKVVVVLLTMSLLGLNCWGLSGLKNDFDRTWFLNPGYQRDFVSAVQDLFPESGYRADFYIGNTDYFREKEALEELFNRLSALPGIKNGSIEFWHHSFLEYLKEKKGKPIRIKKVSTKAMKLIVTKRPPPMWS